jgi:uroporphyrinogen decarboxylase
LSSNVKAIIPDGLKVEFFREVHMDSRTRVCNAIERKPIDRIPRYDSPWVDTIERWKSEGLPGDTDLVDFFDFDFILIGVDISMRYEHKLISEDNEYRVIRDRYGYTTKSAVGVSRTFEVLDCVTENKDVWKELRHRFQFDPNDTARIDGKSYFLRLEEYPSWEEAKRQYERWRKRGKYLVYHGYGPWEGTWRHRGYTSLMMDVATDPDWVHEMGLAGIELFISTLKHAIKLGMKPDAVFLIDDLGSTKSLLFSPDSWRTIFKPIYRQMGNFLNENDISFWLHCCGNCEALIPDFIECGLNVLQPLQVHAGLDIRKLMPLYGDRLTFWGNIDARKMIGAPEPLEEEIRSKLSLAKKAGGYMYHSDHSVPPEVSLERFKWIMKLVEKYGTFL